MGLKTPLYGDIVHDLGPLRQASIEERGKMKRLLMVAASVFVLVLAAASAALAGEIKGPPGTPCGPGTDVPVCTHSTDFTQGPTHANSFCAFSGLNDMDPTFGQTSRITQTPKDGYPGAPAHGFLIPDGNGGFISIDCKGGDNLARGSGG